MIVANVATVIHLGGMARGSVTVTATDVTLLRRLHAPLREVDAAAPERAGGVVVAASAALRVRGLVPLASAVTLLGGAAAAGRDLLAFGGPAARAGVAS